MNSFSIRIGSLSVVCSPIHILLMRALKFQKMVADIPNLDLTVTTTIQCHLSLSLIAQGHS